MNILAIDTSSKSACVCLYCDGEIKADMVVNHGKNHSIFIVPMIKNVLDTLETKLEDIDYFACGVGPGSFTGVRIGTTIMKTFAQIYDKKCVSVDSLCALNESEKNFDGIVVAVEDARRDRVYVRATKNGEEVIESKVLPVEELNAMLVERNEKVIFVGSGADKYGQALAKDLTGAVVKTGALIRGCDIVGVAVDKIANDDVCDCYELLPNYLMKSQAEREKDANNKTK